MGRGDCQGEPWEGIPKASCPHLVFLEQTSEQDWFYGWPSPLFSARRMKVISPSPSPPELSPVPPLSLRKKYSGSSCLFVFYNKIGCAQRTAITLTPAFCSGGWQQAGLFHEPATGTSPHSTCRESLQPPGSRRVFHLRRPGAPACPASGGRCISSCHCCTREHYLQEEQNSYSKVTGWKVLLAGQGGTTKGGCDPCHLLPGWNRSIPKVA